MMSEKDEAIIRLDFEVVQANEGGELPTSEELADALMDEIQIWDAYSYQVTGIKYDYFKNTPEQDLLITRLGRQKINLADRVRNLVEKNGNQVEIIKDLTRRNDSQYNDLGSLNQRIEAQREDIRKWRKLTDELRNQVDDLEQFNSDANVKLLAQVARLEAGNSDANVALLTEVAALEAELEEVESHRDHLIQDKDTTMKYYKDRASELHKSNQALQQINNDQAVVIRGRDAKIAGLESRLNDALLSYETAAKERNELKATNFLHTTENQGTNEMVARIVDAMTEAGYPIAGWGNDAQLTDLEEIEATISDATSELRTALDNIRTER
jgi:DNA repair exonuclease SbcCD ATPase subunit